MKPERKLPRGLVFHALRSHPLVVAVAPGHAYARRREVNVAEVLAGPLVAYSRREYPNYHRLLARTLGPRIRKLPLAEECDSGPSLIAAVESGKGVSVVPAFLATTAGRRLKFIALTPSPAQAVVGLAYREVKPGLSLRLLAETARKFSNT